MAVYSAIEHHARSIWLGKWRDGWFGMFSGYFDKSGDWDTGLTVVSGFVADVRKWIEFESSWSLVLARYHAAYFHMKEFVHSKGPVYGTWKGDVTKQANFLRELIGVVEETGGFWVSSTLPNAAFKEIDREFAVREAFEAPYPIAAMGCIQQAHRILAADHSVRAAQQLELIFEDGDEGKGKLIELVDQSNTKAVAESRATGRVPMELFPYPIPTPSFRPSVDPLTGTGGVLPLQAADFAAWEIHKFQKTAEKQPTFLLRRSLVELLKRIHGDNRRLSKAHLRQLCHTHDVPPRKGL